MPLKWSLWSADSFPRKQTISVRITFVLICSIVSVNCCLHVYTVSKILLTSMFPLFRCVDRRVGGYWCLSCHCKRAGHWCVFGLHPSTGVPLPLWPMCQRHSSGCWVRMSILLENFYVLSCCVQHSLFNKWLYFFQLHGRLHQQQSLHCTNRWPEHSERVFT